MTISVNISARQLQKKDLSADIAVILRETGLEPRFLELEIVESMVMQDVESAMVDHEGVEMAGGTACHG